MLYKISRPKAPSCGNEALCTSSKTARLGQVIVITVTASSRFLTNCEATFSQADRYHYGPRSFSTVVRGVHGAKVHHRREAGCQSIAQYSMSIRTCTSAAYTVLFWSGRLPIDVHYPRHSGPAHLHTRGESAHLWSGIDVRAGVLNIDWQSSTPQVGPLSPRVPRRRGR